MPGATALGMEADCDALVTGAQCFALFVGRIGWAGRRRPLSLHEVEQSCFVSFVNGIVFLSQVDNAITEC